MAAGLAAAGAGRDDRHRLVGYLAVTDIADAAGAAANARALAEAGAGTIVVQPPEGSDLDPVGLVRFAAGQVRPLLRLTHRPARRLSGT